MTRAGALVGLAVLALAVLAAVLWDDTVEPETVAALDDARCAGARHVAETMPKPASIPPKSRIPTFDGGRTTIPPKVSEAAIARIRGG